MTLVCVLVLLLLQCKIAPLDALASDSPTRTSTHTPTSSRTESPSHSPTRSPSHSPTRSPSNSPSETPSDTPTETPSRSPTETPTRSPSKSPSHTPTRSRTPSRTDSTTRTPTPTSTNSLSSTTAATAAASESATATVTEASHYSTPTPPPSASAPPTASESPSLSASASATATGTTTATPSSVAVPAVGAALGGLAAGAALYQFSLAFLIPWVLGLLHAAAAARARSGGGSGAGAPDEKSPLLAGPTGAPKAPPSSDAPEAAAGAATASTSAAAAAAAAAASGPSAYQVREIARLSACVSDLRQQLEGLRAAAAAQAAGPGFADSAQPLDAATAALNALWDREDFLRACAETTAVLVKLCDDALADAYDGSVPAIAAAMRDLYAACSVAAAAQWAECEAAEGGAEGARGAFALRMADKSEDSALAGAAAGVAAGWLAQQQQIAGSELRSPAVAAAVQRLALVTLQCALWPLASDANIAWQLQLPEAPAPLDNDLHQQFSLTGVTLKAGAAVVAIGPALVPRQPRASGSEPALERQVTDLRGRRCRAVVLAAQ